MEDFQQMSLSLLLLLLQLHVIQVDTGFDLLTQTSQEHQFQQQSLKEGAGRGVYASVTTITSPQLQSVLFSSSNFVDKTRRYCNKHTFILMYFCVQSHYAYHKLSDRNIPPHVRAFKVVASWLVINQYLPVNHLTGRLAYQCLADSRSFIMISYISFPYLFPIRNTDVIFNEQYVKFLV